MAYDLYIADALKEFRSAVEIAPDEPWLWFEIGWLNLIDSDEVVDPDTIRTAWERALDIDPDLVAAHVALAYMEAKVSIARHSNTNEWLEWLRDLGAAGVTMELLENQMAEGEDLEAISASQAQIDELGAELRRTLEGIQQRLHQAIWTGPSGEHLRAARGHNWEDLFWAVNNVTIAGTDVVIEFYPFATGSLRIFDLLDELGEYLPTSERANFYHLIGMGFCNGGIRPAGATWFEYDIK